VTVQLKGGGARNSVVLEAQGFSGPNLDAMTVRPAQPVAILQAEEATRGGGAIVSRSRSGFTGTGYVDYVNNTGDYAEWTFDAPAGRDYVLSFRYANGGSVDRPLQVMLDGIVVAENPLSFAPTGSWSTWRTSSITLGLDGPRRHRIRLTAIGSSGPNIDLLIIS
jgi:Carbohydrate binding module (family 6)